MPITHNLLDYFLITQLFAFLLIFCRVGAAVMMMPAVGDVYVSPRTRLIFALAISLLLTPMLMGKMPVMPESNIGLLILILGEVLIGTFIGMIARTILIVVHVAGAIIALQSSLASAAIFDPASGGQSAVFSNLLTITALALFFALNLHHLVIASIVQSYDIFQPGIFPNTTDMNTLNTRLVSDSFNLGVLLAAPHIVFSLLFYLAGGLMTRLMPNFQVFFVMMSPQILIAFFIMFAILVPMLQIFMGFMSEQLSNFVTGAGNV